MPGLLVVTTRSRLRGVRQFPAMFLATRRVRRQLASTEGVVRWASVIASPTEFWTITVWRSRHEMQEFMRSDAHGDIMWDFRRLLRSLWLVRWRPTARELGSWRGVRVAAPPQPGAGWAPAGPAGLAEPVGLAGPAELAGPVGLAEPAGPAVLPELRDSTGPDGVISYDASPGARRARAQLKGVGGAVMVLQTPRLGAPAALLRLKRHQRRLFTDPALLRSIVGLGSGGHCCLLTVWRTPADAARLLEGPWAQALQRRYGERLWANEWAPESEFGHWDGLRLRGGQRRVPHLADPVR